MIPTERCELDVGSQKPDLESLVLTLKTQCSHNTNLNL